MFIAFIQCSWLSVVAELWGSDA